MTIGLVLLGHDLGTVMVMVGIVAAVLFAAGVPRRHVRLRAVPCSVPCAVTMVVDQPQPAGRGSTCGWARTPTPTAPAARPLHGRYALADGGWWGVGLGASREKWQWLPEAHNDFIFAILGEELGLPGTLVLLGAVLRAGAGLLPDRAAQQRHSSSGSPRPG